MSFYLWNDPATNFVNYVYENIATHPYFFLFFAVANWSFSKVSKFNPEKHTSLYIKSHYISEKGNLKFQVYSTTDNHLLIRWVK